MFKRILIPVDGSDASNEALPQALAFACDAGARVRFVHVMDPGSLFIGFDPSGTITADLMGVFNEQGTKILNKAVASAQALKLTADSALFDDPRARLGETVRNAAMLWNADLIITGSHGRRGVGRVLLGSGAEGIIRQAPVPVLVIRSGTAQAK